MDNCLLEKVTSWLSCHRSEIISDLQGLVRVQSISDCTSNVKPFGQGCRDALTYMKELAASHGLPFRDYDGYIGEIPFSEGDASVGFWAHLDTVPTGDIDMWDYPPYECRLVEGRYLIGRGVQDNKMAAISMLHVFRCLRDLFPSHTFRHGYSLFLGTSEETGMQDVQYFISHYTCPDLSIVPDCGFPVCCAQRGSMKLQLQVPVDFSCKIKESNHPSVTPEEVICEKEDGTSITVHGKSSHIFNADNIQNANLLMLDVLGNEFPDNANVLTSLKNLCSSWHGESLGIDCEDEFTGKVMMAATKMTVEGGFCRVTLSLILPASFNENVQLEKAMARAESAGVTCSVLSLRKPVFFPQSHPVVEKLTCVYNAVMGKHDKPYAMSGGNYAAYLPNAFGFGPGMERSMPKHIFREGHGDYHQYDESEDVEHMLTSMKIYAMAVAALEEMTPEELFERKNDK